MADFGGGRVLLFRRGVGGAGARLFVGLHEDVRAACRATAADNKKAAEGGFRLFGGAGDGNRTHGSSLGS